MTETAAAEATPALAAAVAEEGFGRFSEAVSLTDMVSDYVNAPPEDSLIIDPEDMPAPKAEEKVAGADEPVAKEDPDEGEDAPTEEAPEGADAETTEQETSALETLSDLAEQLEVPVDDLLSTLKHTYKAAGEEHTATLSELIEGNQFRKDYDRKNTQLAQDRTRLEGEAQARIAKLETEYESLAARFGIANQMLETEEK